MMQRLCALLGVLPLCVCAVLAAADEQLSGIYQGHVGAASATLTLRVSHSVVTGRITRSGGTDIDLNGTLSEGKIIGAASIGRATGFFEAYRELGALIVILSETGAVTGQSVELRAEFFPASETVVADKDDATAAQPDKALVGTWTTHSYERRGDMVLPVTSTMVLAADGDYSYKSEPITESKQGQWRSHDGRLEYRPKDAETWSTLGEYQLRGNNLIIMVPDRDPQLWTRFAD